MSKNISCWVLVLVFFSAFLQRADALELNANLEGEWYSDGNSTNKILFYGNQVGSSVENGVERYFQYTASSTNALNISYGGDNTEIVTISQNKDALTVINAQNASMSYQRINSFTNGCQKSIMQMIAAQKLCKQVDPTIRIIAIPDMLGYLLEMPVCPHGGTFLMQPGHEPSCSRQCGVKGGDK